jgi:hypothetical protein
LHPFNRATEVLAKDWGYDLESFRELGKIKIPNIRYVELKPLALKYGLPNTNQNDDFFELFANKP